MISVHIRILSLSTHLSPREQEGSHSQARNKVITRNQTYHHPGPQVYRIIREITMFNNAYPQVYGGL